METSGRLTGREGAPKSVRGRVGNGGKGTAHLGLLVLGASRQEAEANFDGAALATRLGCACVAEALRA